MESGCELRGVRTMVASADLAHVAVRASDPESIGTAVDAVDNAGETVRPGLRNVREEEKSK